MSEGATKKEEKPRKFQAIRGTRDLLPPETALWTRVEQTAQEVFALFGFGEIRLPIFEPTVLFARSIGADTDIVSKEMFTFDLGTSSYIKTWRAMLKAEAYPKSFQQRLLEFKNNLKLAWQEERIEKSGSNRQIIEILDKTNEKLFLTLNGEILYESEAQRQTAVYRLMAAALLAADDLELEGSVVLRPEATASVCRSYIEHNMQQLPQPVKLYYMGPMFRRERPQKGRYRQFYQIGAEVLGGSDAPAIDAEVIEMVMTFFDRLELQGVQLDINSIGCRECRPKYVELLRAELLKVKDKLGPDSQRRIETNPLRVLDSKVKEEQSIIENLPRIADHLCKDCALHYADVKHELELRGVKYRENWRLVRGLDYYTRTTFEITAKGLGSQNAVCGGGRYDGLVELLGGPPTKGIGFAIGEDRLILSLQESGQRRSS